MTYKKLLKLSKMLEVNSPLEAKYLKKLASERAFESLVLGSYPFKGGNEHEAKVRKARVIDAVNDDSKVYASVSELARIINGNSDVKDYMTPEGHLEFWRGEGNKTLKSALHDELRKILLRPQADPQPEFRYREPPRDSRVSLVEIERAVRIYLQNMEDITRATNALMEPRSVLIPMVSDKMTLGNLINYNSTNKQATFVFKKEDGSLDRVSFILDNSNPSAARLKEINNRYSYVSGIKSIELNGLFDVVPIPKIKIPRSDRSESFGIIVSQGYEPGRGYTVTTSFQVGLSGATKQFDEASGSLGGFVSENPDLMNLGRRR